MDWDMPVNAELARLLELAKDHTMTPEEIREQRISWAYGNLAIEDDSVTKEHVRETAKWLGIEPGRVGE